MAVEGSMWLQRYVFRKVSSVGNELGILVLGRGGGVTGEVFFSDVANG